MKLLLRIILVLLVAWLEVSFMGQLRPLGVIPNLMLILVIVTAFWSSATASLTTAVGGGLLIESFSGSDFGLQMAFLVLVALVVVTVRQLGFHDSALGALVVVAVATLIWNLLVISTIHVGLGSEVLSRILREVAINLTITGLVYLTRANFSRGDKSSLELSPRVWQ